MNHLVPRTARTAPGLRPPAAAARAACLDGTTAGRDPGRAARVLWLSMWLGASACGSRSQLLDCAPFDTSAGGGSTGDPCAPPAVTATCAEFIADAEPGSEVWSTTLDTGALRLVGPLSADAEGGTYYAAAESGLYTKTILALDACGALRWQSDIEGVVAANGVLTRVMVAAGRLLLVSPGNVVALDIASGEHLWTADLQGFGEAGGLGVPPGKVVALGFAAARADGTVFTTIANDLDVWIVSVSPEGDKIHPVAKIDHYLSPMSYPLSAQELVIDAAGDVILAGRASSGSGAPVHAFTPEGEAVFAVTLPNGGLGQSLVAGPDDVAGPSFWILNLDGTLRADSLTGGPAYSFWDGPSVIDADGALYVVGSDYPQGSKVPLLGRFTPAGEHVWSVPLDESVYGGPVLGDHDRVFVLTSAGFEPGSPTHIVAFGADGSLAWKTDVGPSGQIPSYWLLQSAAGALIVVRDGQVRAFASGGSKPPTCAYWPTPGGDLGQRACARGR